MAEKIGKYNLPRDSNISSLSITLCSFPKESVYRHNSFLPRVVAQGISANVIADAALIFSLSP